MKINFYFFFKGLIKKTHIFVVLEVIVVVVVVGKR
jgi:hypothetical protein